MGKVMSAKPSKFDIARRSAQSTYNTRPVVGIVDAGRRMMLTRDDPSPATTTSVQFMSIGD